MKPGLIGRVKHLRGERSSMDESRPPFERRQHPREIVAKEAIIITDGGKFSCSIRNQHERGAELRVAADASVPDRFVLSIPEDGAAYQAVVRWRKSDRLGVQLYGTGVVIRP